MRRYELDINGKHFSIVVHEYSARRAELEIDGSRYTVDVVDVVSEGVSAVPFRPGAATARPLPVTPAAVAAPRAATPAGVGSITAPIPGQILALLVKQGEHVTPGQPLVRIEAMKMENTIIAPVAGTVGVIHVNPGDAVTQGQELLVIA